MTRLAAALLAVMPLAAAAQDAPSCGGIGVVGAWLGGSEAASDPGRAGGPLDAEGTVPIAGHLVRLFALDRPAELRVEVAAPEGGDPYFAVLDESGAEVLADDDSGGGFAARAEAELGPGRYCIAARAYGSGLTGVALRVGLTGHPALTAGVDAPPAPAAQGGGCGAADVARIGDGLTAGTLAGAGVALGGSAAAAPGRAFSLAERTALTITAVSTGGDPVIRLLDASGAQLAENDDADGLDSRIDTPAPLAPGAYCVEVEDLNASDAGIVVTLTGFDAAADRRARLDAAEFAPGPSDSVPVDALGPVRGSLVHDVDASAAARWLSFEMPEGGLLVTEAIASGSLDPVVVLFDRVGRRIAENDDGPAGLDSFLATRLPAGEYLLALRLLGEGEAGTVRVLLERFVPAE
jgi:hypothetical protein